MQHRTMQVRIADLTKGRVSLQGEQLKVEGKESKTVFFPLHQTDQIIIQNQCTIDTQLMQYCAQKDISILLDYGKHLPIEVMKSNKQQHRIGIKKIGYQICQQEHIRVVLANRLIIQKVRQQQVTIKKLMSTYNLRDYRCDKFISEQFNCKDLAKEQLLGYEGSMTAKYFHALRTFVPEWTNFTHRKRRPPPDPANAILSLVYTMAFDEVTRALLQAGFEPLFGVLHADSDYRYGLSCDVIELFRAELDVWSVYLLNEIFEEDDFEYKTNGVFLAKTSKGKFYKQWYIFKKQLKQKMHKRVNFIKNKVYEYEP